MEDKLGRLEEQMKKLIADFRDACEKNDGLRQQNERLLSDLMEKNRQLEVLEERGMVLMETQAEKKRLEQQHERIRKETKKILEKVQALKGGKRK